MSFTLSLTSQWLQAKIGLRSYVASVISPRRGFSAAFSEDRDVANKHEGFRVELDEVYSRRVIPFRLRL